MCRSLRPVGSAGCSPGAAPFSPPSLGAMGAALQSAAALGSAERRHALVVWAGERQRAGQRQGADLINILLMSADTHMGVYMGIYSSSGSQLSNIALLCFLRWGYIQTYSKEILLMLRST